MNKTLAYMSQNSSNPANPRQIPLSAAPVTARTWWLLVVSQMEQTVVNVLTVVVGVVLPMMKLYYMQTQGTEPSVLIQGCIAAAGLTGISVGSPIFGYLGDRHGYLWYFRLCGVLILAGGLGGWLLTDSPWLTVASLFTVGLGIGGGYSLDDVYLSELMPAKQRSVLIVIAKTLAAFGCFWAALVALGVLHAFPHASMWRYSMMILATLGLVTVLMRIRWWESPRWLIMQGRIKDAEYAIHRFMGPQYTIDPSALSQKKVQSVPIGQMFRGERLWKVIATSVPWALEGVGAFGMATFFPIILMSLGLHLGADATGVAKIEDSVWLSTFIYLFFVIGFALGVPRLKRQYHITVMTTGFYVCTASIIMIVLAHVFSWPLWVGVALFALFVTSMCSGPGAVTFLLPSEVYTEAERGVGAGIAASVGKLGAIIAVFLLPWFMKEFGIDAALIFCAACMLTGGIVTNIAGPRALPRKKSTPK